MKKYLAPLVLYAVLLALFPDREARSTGSLTIPFTIAAQSGPTLSAALLDTNWTTIASYINAREVSSGTLAARPAAGTAGRWYTATDQNGGTTYWDNGSAWVQVGPAVNNNGVFAVRNLQGATSVSTNTTYNVTADFVVLRNPTDGSMVTRPASVSRSNSILTSGPAVDGRDQAAAFSAPTWVHFYYIWNGATLSTLSSLCTPGDINGACSTAGGPTLPTGYTHWAYIGAVRMATAGTLNATYARGGKMLPLTESKVVNAVGITTVEATVSTASFVPPNATSYTLFCSANTTANVSFGTITNTYSNITSVGGAAPSVYTVELPQISTQQFFFLGSGASSTLTCDVQSYQVPNGG